MVLGLSIAENYLGDSKPETHKDHPLHASLTQECETQAWLDISSMREQCERLTQDLKHRFYCVVDREEESEDEENPQRPQRIQKQI